jgi:glycosyltransferase involved in cell wall biosynthesis
VPPTCSIILTTHNNPRALEFVLHGYARQQLPQGATFEILVADDGSRDETREALNRTVRELRSRGFSAPLRHVWQPHRGYYNKSGIVNKCILLAQSDYLILADADVIPRDDFVRTHLALRRPRCFLAAGDFRLSDGATKALTLADVDTGKAFDPAFLRAIGQPRTKKFVKLLRIPRLTRAMDAINFSPARWSGSNCSCWKDMLLEVGGFDEAFQGPGKDDTELGHRLWNAGYSSRHARHNAIALHMEHGHGNYNAERKARNFELLAETRATNRTLARVGIAQATHDQTVREL